MKSFLLTLLFFSLFIHLCFAQWEILNEGSNGRINTIEFVNENVGWIAGYGGTLFKTTNGGVNWNSIPLNESWNINHIDFINESVGWAVGSDSSSYVIWKTNDGGLNWTQQHNNIGFNSIYVIDENYVYVFDKDTIFKTTDGGNNWIDVSPNLPNRNYNSIWFQNPDTGVVVGNDSTVDRGIILKTTDGGISWGETIVNEFDNIYDLQFLDNTHGYFRAKLDTTNFICKTESLCQSWVVITQRPYSITSYKFLNRDTIFAIMEDSITTNNIMKSIDMGVTWQNIQSFNIVLQKVYFSMSGQGFLLGNFGWSKKPVIYNSNNGGDNWIVQKFTYPINDVCFIDKDKGFLEGGFKFGNHGRGSNLAGHFLSSTDGGKSWDIEYEMNNLFQSCVFVNDSAGFSLAQISQTGHNGIFKTTDYGNNWITVYNQDNYTANDICFSDEGEGFVVGRYDDTFSSGIQILYTVDGGLFWDLASKFPDNGNYEYNLYSICRTSTTFWSVGEGGMIAKYTTQTGWTKQTSITDLPLNKVFFSDNDHGWIVGGYQNYNDFHQILLKTTNGGVNWITVTSVPYLFKDIWFIDNNLGYALGYDSSRVGGILKTTDGGISWVIDKGNLNYELNSLFIKDGYGWAVGNNGLILRTTNAGTVWVEDESNRTYPPEFILGQNYPNPFNPSTKIKYSIPRQSKVILKIYDVLGNEIKILVNEEKRIGDYEVDFNGSGLASGIYFYQLRTGSFVETKKMLLLK